MRRISFLLISTSTMLALLFQSASAAFISEWEGTTVVTVKVAALRSGWNDAPIIAAIHLGDKLIVHSLGGHGNGAWLKVTVKDTKGMQGYIDVRQTSFWKDVHKGAISQPGEQEAISQPDEQGTILLR